MDKINEKETSRTSNPELAHGRKRPLHPYVNKKGPVPDLSDLSLFFAKHPTCNASALR